VLLAGELLRTDTPNYDKCLEELEPLKAELLELIPEDQSQINPNFPEIQDYTESTPAIENYPGDAVFLNYCLENQVTLVSDRATKHKEIMKCMEVG